MAHSFGSKTTRLAVERPRLVARTMVLVTLVLMTLAGLPTLFPDGLHFLAEATIDTDPENMLPASDPARVFHNENKARFNLHDAVVVGVVNHKADEGVFNPATLKKVYALTEFAKGLEGVVVPDLMALSTMDSIEHTSGGVRFDWLMPEAPQTKEDALAIRERAMRIPFLRGTMVSDDGKALVIYVPIEDKTLAHEVSTSLSEEIERLGEGDDQFHIAGLPVAEDTFGIEMFIQMAISAPMAMLVIFLLMWFFFRNFTLILAPMYVAMAAALSTMGLLIITGNTVHIMSSMIPIFIMPIAVLDAVHIISDFFDTYPESRDRKTAIQQVMRHLSAPMLFTSLTTAAGFASLALTPIPPVQVFGIFVAIGVLAAWLFTILFVPAYIMMLSPERLENFGRTTTSKETSGGILAAIGRMRGPQAKLILVCAMGLVAVAVIGIQKIEVNDNPTNWFEEDHEIRIADRVLNQHFGGTYDAYLSLQLKQEPYSAEAFHEALMQAALAEARAIDDVFREVGVAIDEQNGTELFAALEAIDSKLRSSGRTDPDAFRRTAWGLAQDVVTRAFHEADEGEETVAPSLNAAELHASFDAQEEAAQESYASLEVASDTLRSEEPADKEAYLDKIKNMSEHPLQQDFLDRFEQREQVFKDPALLRFVEELQAAMDVHPAIGKSNSIADIVKVVHRDLLSGEQSDYRLPNTPEVVAQTLTQYQSSHRKDDLWHFVTPDYQNAVIWFQLKSGDNIEMQAVIEFVSNYLAANESPIALEPAQWFGLTYINVVWQQKMVTGMVNAMLGSFVIVLLMMTFLFRSLFWGLLSMIPLTLTVALIYGILGLVGKDYDMPVAVLSSLSLGLAVDYSIHFIARARELHRELGSWKLAQAAVFQAPARAIARNVAIVGLGFLPLLLAPLVPYQTVGILIASILIAAGLATLLLLPAMIGTAAPLLFRQQVKLQNKDS